MIDFFFLVPIAIGLRLASCMWTLKDRQYDDLQGPAERILFEGPEGAAVGDAISGRSFGQPEDE